MIFIPERPGVACGRFALNFRHLTLHLYLSHTPLHSRRTPSLFLSVFSCWELEAILIGQRESDLGGKLDISL